ncbi:MAG: phenylacetate--CoA ligase family protein, partial [Actinomycetota bacterium]
MRVTRGPTVARRCRAGRRGGVSASRTAAHDRPYFDAAHETLEPGALRALQLERLQRVVAHAYERSTAYRDLCRAAGVAPDDIATLDDLRRLPLLEKATLRDAYPAGLRTCGLDEIIEVHSTSGTTGKPTPIWATRGDMDAWAERNARTMWMVGLRPGDLLQNCFGYGLPTSIGLQYGAQHAGIGVVPAGIGRHELLIDLIVDLGVTAVCTTPSYGLFLADKALERRIDLSRDSRLRVGIFGAEPWPESGRDRLAAALGVDAFNEYGMGEFLGPGMACECSEKNGMHVWSDHLFVECVD